MERLTKIDGIGKNECIKCFGCDPEKAGAELEHCGYCEHWQSILDRLAAYEDTGLTPEEAAKLAQAKADGRLVEMPCKIGADVYTIGEDYFECDNCKYKDEATEIYNNRRCCSRPIERRCPYIIKTNRCKGFEIGENYAGENCLFGPGEFGYEGLEEFGGIDGKVYYSMEDAEAAKAALEKETTK